MIERLDYPINNYKAIVSISRKAHLLTKQNVKYISEFNLPILGKKTNDKNKEIDNYFDLLSDKLLEYAYMELISIFEAIVIEKVKNASGNMKRILKDNYNGNDFQNFEDRFVKNESDIGSLNKIEKLLENKIPNELFLELSEIVKYRNRLAHGKRFNENVVLGRIEDTRDVMKKILDKINQAEL